MKQWFGEHILGLPPLASTNGRGVDDLIIYVHWLMIALFIGWIIYFFYAVNRFRRSRNPKADYVGVKKPRFELPGTGHRRHRGGVCWFLSPCRCGPRLLTNFPAAKESTVIQVVAQQYAWNARYPGPDGEFGRQDMKFVQLDNVFGVDPSDPNGKDDIQLLNEIHVPLGKPVIMYVTSKDVIHSLKIIAMRVCQDAIPGLRVPLLVCADACWPLQINCAQPLRAAPWQHGGWLSGGANPGRLRQMAQVQDRCQHQLRVT